MPRTLSLPHHHRRCAPKLLWDPDSSCECLCKTSRSSRLRRALFPCTPVVLANLRPPARSQLLQLVVDFPRKSTVDMRFLSHIWEAFLRWCAQQFDARIGVRVMGMGEFCYRLDRIGDMEFFNPMFVMNESFCQSFGLHDRRPKTQAVETECIDVDMSAIASLTTDILGEVIGKEVIENALQDLIERIGEVCADPDQYGIITIDFGFAKLFCENKSLEFSFGDARGAKPGLPPTTASSTRSTGKAGSLPALGNWAVKGQMDNDAMSVGGSSILSKSGHRKGGAPLQRPHRPHMRPKHAIFQATKDDVLASHVQQLSLKDHMVHQTKEEETSQHLDTLQRLRSEMVLDYSQREQRKDLMKVLAVHQKVQQDEKRRRDEVDRRPIGTDHWPFRTEEQVQQSIEATNRAQKAFLDKQLEEKHQKLAFLKAEADKRAAVEQQQALEELKALEGQMKGGKPSKTGGGKATGKAPVHGVERALEDAFSRYEDYLHTRKEGIEHMSSFVREQRYLSEQAELLKGEENRRRLAEMRSYLERQVRDKESAKAKAIQLHKAEQPSRHISALPSGSEIDAEEEAYVKMALKHALDGQVERKVQTVAEERAASIAAEQQALGYVAAEMQEARYRAYSERREQEAALRSTWAKQQQLKLMEATLDKADAA